MLTVKLVDPGKILTLKHNGNKAINSKLSTKFGNKTCNYFATAYNEIAESISKLSPGTEVLIEGALYQENFTDKITGQMRSVNKIRITKIIQEDNEFFEEPGFTNF
jgi:single-stranded DNA-binding protein